MDSPNQNVEQKERKHGSVGQESTPLVPPVTDQTARSEDASGKQSKRGDSSLKAGCSRPRKGKRQGSRSSQLKSEGSTRHLSALTIDRLWRTGRFLSISALVVASALVFVYLLFIKDPLKRVAVCQTEDCMAHAVEILTTLNKLADPCHDFYEFACGKPNQAKPQQPLVERMYLKYIEVGSRDLDGKVPGSRVSAELLFQSCVDQKRSEIERSLAEFLEFRRQRGMRWPEEPQPTVGGVGPLDLMLDLAINWNLNFLFDVHVLELPWHTINETTSDLAVALVLSRGKLGYVWQRGVHRSLNQTLYEIYVKKYYQVLAVTESNISSTILWELEEAIVAAKLNVVTDESEQVRVFDRLVLASLFFGQVWFKMRALDNTTSAIGPGMWLALLNKQFSGQFTWTGEHWIVVDGPAVLTHLDKLLKAYSKHLLVIGLAWIFIQTHLWAVANKPDLVFAESPIKARKYGCFEYAESLFGLLSVAGQFTRTFGLVEARHHLDDFEHTLRSAVARKLRESSWINTGAREVALRKLERLSMSLLPPSELFDEEWRQTLAKGYAAAEKMQGFMSNLLSAMRSYRALRSKLSQFMDVYGRRMFPSDRYASYVYIANRADMALGSVAPPLYYLNGTFSVNYAGLGTVVAALLASSFDPRGIRLDDTGVNVSWWKQTDYLDRAECALGDERHPPGHRMVQVFPSVVALEIAFAAYKLAVAHDPRNLADFRLRYLETFKDDQIFFISYCHAVCGDGLSSRDLCNLPLRHFQPFVDAFGCSQDTRMNAHGKCRFFNS